MGSTARAKPRRLNPVPSKADQEALLSETIQNSGALCPTTLSSVELLCWYILGNPSSSVDFV